MAPSSGNPHKKITTHLEVKKNNHNKKGIEGTKWGGKWNFKVMQPLSNLYNFSHKPIEFQTQKCWEQRHHIHFSQNTVDK